MINRIIIFWILNLEKFLNLCLFLKFLYLFFLNIIVLFNLNIIFKKSYDIVINYVYVDFKNLFVLMRICVIVMYVVYVLCVFDVNFGLCVFKKL